MFKYQIWLEGNCLHEDDEFETEEEATEEATDWIADKLDEWEADGVRDGYTVDDFEIQVKEY